MDATRATFGFAVSFAIVLGVSVVLFLWLYPRIDHIVAVLHATFVASPPPKAAGFLASIISATVTFLYAAVSQNRKPRNHIRRYRRAEELLVEKKRLTRSDILEYHAQYNWDVYAGISFSTLLVIVSLLFTFGDTAKYQPIDYLIIFASMLLLAVSAMILAIVDMFHTNSLSPLITCRKRFELIDIIIKLGSFAIMIQMCAITMFLTLLNAWLSIAVSVVSLAVIVFFSRLRSIPLSSLMEEHQLTDEEVEEIRHA